MRKTNLFYTDGPDSKFLTFSNYTESLTGNFISTDTKIFPSTFLCLYIEKLNDENGRIDAEKKKEFINKYLVGYYENKLAVLHDIAKYNNENPEKYIKPLSYLLKTISMFINEGSEEGNEESIQINYINDITEQDYNGSYTDTICIVDFNKYYILDQISSSDNQNYKIASVTENIDRLHGWNESQLSSWFSDQVPEPIYDNTEDNTGIYCYNDNEFDSMQLLLSTNISDSEKTNKIKFNVIIPLYDVTNMNYHTNETFLEDYKDTLSIDLKDDTYRKYVPLGIWFADKTVELYKDTQTGFTQTWSLVISSQFKPFPYAKMQVNDPNEKTNSNAFPTFAMILSRQNEILDKFQYLENLISEQNNVIAKIRSDIQHINTIENVDNIKKNFIEYEYNMTNKFNDLKQEVYNTLNNLRWKGAE